MKTLFSKGGDLMATGNLNNRLFKGIITAAFVPVCLMSILPMWIIIVASFTKDKAISDYGYRLWPAIFSLDAYRYLISKPGLVLRAYLVSITVTVTGTIIGLILMSMLSYTISRRGFKPGKWMGFYVFFTMLFNGGVVPYYILITKHLHLKNNILVLVLPLLISPFYVMLLRTYFRNLPVMLFEAAKLDGAGEMRMFFIIALPLSLPAMATIALFSMLTYWNDMYQALLFIDNQNLYPLQYLLYKLIYNAGIIQEGAQYTGTITPYQSIRMAMAVLAIAPVLFSFAFIQKYFIRGITLGGLKGD